MSYEDIYIKKIESGFRKFRSNKKDIDLGDVRQETFKYIDKLKMVNKYLGEDYEQRFIKVAMKSLTKV